MKRRQFIITGLLGTGGILYTCGNTSASWSNNTTLRVGIIGTGNRGKGLQRFIKDIEGIEVVALADILPFRLEEAKALDPKAKTYSDYRQLLDDPHVDAVIISTPFFNHHEIAIDALDADKHVYCEKTMVKGIANIQPVIDKSNQKKGIMYSRFGVGPLLYLCRSSHVPLLYIYCSPVVPLMCSCSASLVPLVPLLLFLSSSTLPLPFT